MCLAQTSGVQGAFGQCLWSSWLVSAAPVEGGFSGMKPEGSRSSAAVREEMAEGKQGWSDRERRHREIHCQKKESMKKG